MNEVTIRLERNELGQLVEGLDVLIEQWDATAEYLRSGTIRDGVCIRESHSDHEADRIASIYRSIRDEIQKQMAAAIA